MWIGTLGKESEERGEQGFLRAGCVTSWQADYVCSKCYLFQGSKNLNVLYYVLSLYN